LIYLKGRCGSEQKGPLSKLKGTSRLGMGWKGASTRLYEVRSHSRKRPQRGGDLRPLGGIVIVSVGRIDTRDNPPARKLFPSQWSLLKTRVVPFGIAQGERASTH
jgi:hypothetical protein